MAYVPWESCTLSVVIAIIGEPSRWYMTDSHLVFAFGALEQRAEIDLQINCVLVGHLPVHTGGAVLARASIQLAQPVNVDVTG